MRDYAFQRDFVFGYVNASCSRVCVCVCVCVSIHMYVYVCIISLYHYHIAVLKGHWLIFVMCACMYIAKYYESPFFKPRGLECVCMSESMKVFT